MEEADQLDRRRRQDVRRGARAIKQEKHRERQSERERERGGGTAESGRGRDRARDDTN